MTLPSAEHSGLRGISHPEHLAAQPAVAFHDVLADWKAGGIDAIPGFRIALQSVSKRVADVPLELHGLDIPQRRDVYRVFHESALEIVQLLDGLDPVLKKLSDAEMHLPELRKSNDAGRFLRETSIGSTLTWSRRVGRHFLLVAAEERGWTEEAALITSALEALDARFTELFVIPSTFPLRDETQAFLSRAENRIREEDRDIDMDALHDVIDKSVHEKSEHLGEHTRRVGLETYTLSREHLCRLALCAPRDFFRLLISNSPYAGMEAFNLGRVRNEIKTLASEFQHDVHAIEDRYNPTNWTEADDNELAATVESEMHHAIRRYAHYEAFLLGEPFSETVRPQSTPSERAVPNSFLDREPREIFPPAKPACSRLAHWLLNKHERRKDRLQELTVLLAVAKHASGMEDPRLIEQRCAELEAERTRAHTDIAEYKRLLELSTRDDFHPEDLGERFLLDVCPQFLYFKEVATRSAQLLHLRESDSAERFSAIGRERRIAEAKERLIRWSDGWAADGAQTDSYAARTWAIIEEANVRALADICKAAEDHDVGKIGRGKRVLSNRSKLSLADRNDMSEHTRDGSDIMEPIATEVMRHTILDHHTPFDGRRVFYRTTKYTGSLAGNAIPHPSRVVAIADAKKAMEEAREYRREHWDYDVEMLHEYVQVELDLASRTGTDAVSGEKVLWKGRTQFDPEITKLVLLRNEWSADLTNEQVRQQVEAIRGSTEYRRNVGDGVLEVLYNVLRIRSPKKAHHAILTSLELEDTLPRIPKDHPWNTRIEAECGLLGTTRSEWETAAQISALLSELGYITMDDDSDLLNLSADDERYVDHRRAHIEATDRLLAALGDKPWVRAARVANLFHHAKFDGGGFFPTPALAVELMRSDHAAALEAEAKRRLEGEYPRVVPPLESFRPPWDAFLREVGVFPGDPTTPIRVPEISWAHQIMGALNHRGTDEGLPPKLATIRLMLLNWQSQRTDRIGLYDPVAIHALLNAFNTTPEAMGHYLLGRPEDTSKNAEMELPDEKDPHHAHDLNSHLGFTASNARPKFLLQLIQPLEERTSQYDEPSSWIRAVAETTRLDQSVSDYVFSVLAQSAAEMELSPMLTHRVNAAALAHDAGKIKRTGRGSVEENLQQNLLAIEAGTRQHSARNHADASVDLLREAFSFEGLSDDALTYISPKIATQRSSDGRVVPIRSEDGALVLDNKVQLEPTTLPALRKKLRKIGAEVRNPEEQRFITELVGMHQRPLDLLIRLQERADTLVRSAQYGITRNPSGELPAVMLAHTILELAIRGKVEIPLSELSDTVDTEIVGSINTLLRELHMDLNREATAYATIEESFHVQGSIRESLRNTLATELLEGPIASASDADRYFHLHFVSTWLDVATIVLPLADMHAKKQHTEQRIDVNDFIMVCGELHKRATSILGATQHTPPPSSARRMSKSGVYDSPGGLFRATTGSPTSELRTRK